MKRPHLFERPHPLPGLSTLNYGPVFHFFFLPSFFLSSSNFFLPFTPAFFLIYFSFSSSCFLFSFRFHGFSLSFPLVLQISSSFSPPHCFYFVFSLEPLNFFLVSPLYQEGGYSFKKILGRRLVAVNSETNIFQTMITVCSGVLQYHISVNHMPNRTKCIDPHRLREINP